MCSLKGHDSTVGPVTVLNNTSSTWCIGGGGVPQQLRWSCSGRWFCGVFYDIIKIFCYQYWSLACVGLHPTFISRSTVVCRSATLFSCFRCTAARISSIFFRSCKHETAAVRGAHRLQPWRGAFITLHRGSLWGDMYPAAVRCITNTQVAHRSQRGMCGKFNFATR